MSSSNSASAALTVRPTADLQYLQSQATSASSSLRPLYARFPQLYEKKLWYQLTVAVEEFLNSKDSDAGTLRIDLYDKFVRGFSDKINQGRLVGIAVKAARQLSDPAAANAFLSPLLPIVDTPSTQEAHVRAVMECAHFHLLQGQLQATKDSMDKCSKILDSLDAVDTETHAAYYRVSGDYYKAKADYAPYYRSSLLYLACVDIHMDLTLEERVERAHDLSISALLGDTIYNFGELLLHPILGDLESTPHAYLASLLNAFNSGSIGHFESLLPKLHNETILKQNEPFLRQKICLMALIESIFKRANDQRTLPFDTIAQETRLPSSEVEHLVMKALSLKLIKGTLDQHAQLAHVTWVQPRVLDKAQIKALQERLDAWCQRVSQTAEFVKTETPELFASA
ncbi:hypothetical protein IE81DRAFT_217836 [Ceraceosorus guamensis]|uniref:PCI domain-containing protein n=1 Tax=Ceraceosorus guamensis TaxID=1522189 RepID=A0A316VVX2_9BASI|nr:hypothetical protein IE81DRAFT_217836 [Ceraceosorus guamensis]PWN40583.1 hypothetical protein IE81DRAFT_217836 [Ceraceosorus guamensis]